MDEAAELGVQTREDTRLPPASIAGILRLVGNGAGGPILLALGPEPLRTHQLTRRVSHLSPRSAYRHIGILRNHGLVARQSEPGVPSRVVLSLTDPLGRNLCHLLRRFVSTTMTQLPRGGNGAEPWGALTLLGEFWEMGLIDELSQAPKSAVDLARHAHPMTYHQVIRRAGLLATYGLVDACHPNSNGKYYELTDVGRRSMGLISDIGRWRQRHVNGDGTPGLTKGEMATVLRATLQAVRLPKFAEMTIELEVSEGVDGPGSRLSEALRGHIDSAGAMRIDSLPIASIDGSAAATINTWFGVLLDGNRGRVKVRGNLPLVDTCLTQLYDVLWEEG